MTQDNWQHATELRSDESPLGTGLGGVLLKAEQNIRRWFSRSTRKWQPFGSAQKIGQSDEIRGSTKRLHGLGKASCVNSPFLNISNWPASLFTLFDTDLFPSWSKPRREYAKLQ